MPLAPEGSGYAKVLKTEEKGSDVNLATHLLMDGFRDDYELAVVVSNDSDLLLPVQVVTQRIGETGRLAESSEAPQQSTASFCDLFETDPFCARQVPVPGDANR